jgi:2-oxoglutarate dehydrogenase E2 component (dihydrolipoamide succinyltransferase)
MRLSPLVKRMLRDHAIDPATLVGTGPGGRITADDVQAAIDGGGARAAARPATTTSGARAASPRAVTPVRTPGSRVEPLSRTRKVIAERMLQSMQTTAQLTSAVEADVTRIMAIRTQVRDLAKQRYGVSLSPLAFIAHATVRALADHPVLNASIDMEAGEVIYHSGVGLGIAVDAPQGLIVPVLRDAQQLNPIGLQQRIADVAARARDKKLTPDDLQGGTFTITNTGSRGSLFDTPILNPPEVGILATPAIEKRPVIMTDEDGGDRIAIRHRTYLCLSYDHRLVDGADAARFLGDLAGRLDSRDWGPEITDLLAASGG